MINIVIVNIVIISSTYITEIPLKRNFFFLEKEFLPKNRHVLPSRFNRTSVTS